MSSVIFVQRGISSHSDLVMFGNVSEGGRRLVRVGLHCAARVEGEDKWYRVVGISVNSITSVQVKLLDFGGTFQSPCPVWPGC